MANDVTGGDLFKLWQTANVCLPRAAKTYTDVNGGVDGTSNGDVAAFNKGDLSSTDYQYGTAGGRVFAAFAPVRNEFQLIVANTAQNLLDAQTALNNAIEAYCDQDQAAANDLNKNYLEDPSKLDKNDPSQNPPTGDQAPGEPSLPENYESPADEK